MPEFLSQVDRLRLDKLVAAASRDATATRVQMYPDVERILKGHWFSYKHGRNMSLIPEEADDLRWLTRDGNVRYGEKGLYDPFSDEITAGNPRALRHELHHREQRKKYGPLLMLGRGIFEELLHGVKGKYTTPGTLEYEATDASE